MYERPDGGWWISYSVQGRRYREAGGPTRKTADALLAKRRLEVFEGRHFPERRRGDLTLDGLRAMWLAHAANKDSIENDEQRFGVLIELLGAHRRITTITVDDVEAMKAALLARPTRYGPATMPATVNRYLSLLRAALNLAKKNGHNHRDPMASVRLLKEENERDRICSPEEYERLVAAAHPQLRIVIVLAYWTAMRLAEIVHLTRDRTDLDERVVRLGKKHTKDEEARRVPLPEAAADELRAWTWQPDGRLVSMSRVAVSIAFGVLVAELGIEDLHLHDMRHTALTRLRRAGVDLFTIQRISGHRKLETLRRYQTIDDDDLRAAVDRATAAPRSRKPG